MKKYNKFLTLTLAAFLVGVMSLSAQVIVKIRPVVPHYERSVAPSPKHVWVAEEWEARGREYVFVGGHWVLAPFERALWVPGHWQKHRRGGWFWKPGHFRRMR